MTNKKKVKRVLTEEEEEALNELADIFVESLIAEFGEGFIVDDHSGKFTK